jgi:hypothetical protein
MERLGLRDAVLTSWALIASTQALGRLAPRHGTERDTRRSRIADKRLEATPRRVGAEATFEALLDAYSASRGTLHPREQNRRSL